jgi:hypothetical protein
VSYLDAVVAALLPDNTKRVVRLLHLERGEPVPSPAPLGVKVINLVGRKPDDPASDRGEADATASGAAGNPAPPADEYAYAIESPGVHDESPSEHRSLDAFEFGRRAAEAEAVQRVRFAITDDDVFT